MQLIRKHAVLTGITISILLIGIAIVVYPGGSLADEYSTGFSWSKNFMSNLFGTRAINGEPNPSKIWAWAAMIILPCTYALFFINMAKKLPQKGVGNVIKYAAIANIPFTFLTVTHLHDVMLIISTSLFWSCMVMITVFILKSKLYVFKPACIISLVLFYYTIYLWGISDWNLLPIMQKVNFFTSTLLVLGLEYFTRAEDFAHIKSKADRVLIAEPQR
jgi:hypothetical protein